MKTKSKLKKVSRLFKYVRFKSRIKRQKVYADIATKRKILDEFIKLGSAKYAEITDVSVTECIIFNISQNDYEANVNLQTFYNNFKTLCELFSYKCDKYYFGNKSKYVFMVIPVYPLDKINITIENYANEIFCVAMNNYYSQYIKK